MNLKNFSLIASCKKLVTLEKKVGWYKYRFECPLSVASPGHWGTCPPPLPTFLF